MLLCSKNQQAGQDGADVLSSVSLGAPQLPPRELSAAEPSTLSLLVSLSLPLHPLLVVEVQDSTVTVSHK